MNRKETVQIEVLRVFCILTMMWVHVSPGLGTPSVIDGGTFDLVGDVLGQTLGRISVTTLSFVSGYLFWLSGPEKSIWEIFRKRFVRILLPMLVWSAIFILMATVKEVVFERQSSALQSIGGTEMDMVNALTGITGTTANESLFFLRDLFVATLILRLVAPLIRAHPAFLIAVAAVITVLNCTEPILFRPIILLFMLIGATAAQQNLTITRLSSPGISLTLGLLFSVIGALASPEIVQDSTIAERALDVVRRLGVGFIIITMISSVTELFPTERLVQWGRSSFLAYLIHVPLIGVLWVVWTSLVGDERQTTYLAFFLAAPFIVFRLAESFGQILDRCPHSIQLLARGRVIRGDEARDTQENFR